MGVFHGAAAMGAFAFCAELIVMMGAGAAAGRLGIADDRFIEGFSEVLTRLLIPCMAVSVMIRQYSPDALAKGLGMMTGCVLVLLAGAAAGAFVGLVRRKSDDLSAVLLPCVMFINANFIGFPVIQALYGEESLVYANFFMIPYRLLFYTLMPMLFKGISGSGARELFRSVLRAANNPGVCATAAGLVIAVLELPVPGPVLASLTRLGDAALPLGMMACGMYISQGGFPSALLSPGCLAAAACRNLLVPLIVWGLLCRADIDPLVFRELVIFAALPIPSMAALFAKQYGRNAELAASMVFVSTALSVVTLPLWGELLRRFA